MVELRPYQRELLRQIQAALSTDRKARVMMQLPTGGGKTIIAGELLASWLTGGRKAVWLTHRKELAEQTCGMLTDARIPAMTDVNWNPGTDAPAMSHGAVILMAQTVGRRISTREVWNSYTTNDLMVIDEAHHAAAQGWERAMQQWPGRILGMTATPWRLSKKEGFDHLFGGLCCGPQVAELQEEDWLCPSQTLVPPPDQRIIGGELDGTGDFTEAGIELANQDRPNVMTAGVLEFWQKHAAGRPTIAYAVSVDHAHNLTAVFNDVGISAAAILGDTSSEDRNSAIAGFRNGTIKVLINVIVATEGFDLPDASCIVIARPTMSLALYLQMVGRGLRPKDDTCLILDLAANSETHGLPEDYREWSLKPRADNFSGEAPVVWCPVCGTVSPAASHCCANCGSAFGKDCGRCGKWRAWKRWRFENHCKDAHELVCDLCHIDAHIRADLPVTSPLDELIGNSDSENDMPEIDDDLANHLSILLKELLERERQNVTGADDKRRKELCRNIKERDAVFENESELGRRFERHLSDLPIDKRPTSEIQKYRMFADWERKLRSELDGWKTELSELQNRPIDKQAIFTSAKNKVLHLLQRVAYAADLLSPGEGESSDSDGDGTSGGIKPPQPPRPLGPKGNELVKDYLIPVIRLMRNGILYSDACRSVAEHLEVKLSTVRDRTTRGLGINTQEFISSVESGKIVQTIKNKRPQEIELITRELEPLYR